MGFKKIKHRALDKIYRVKKKLSPAILTLIFLFLLSIVIFYFFNNECKGLTNHTDTIDVVYTWVNGSDEKFNEIISLYNSNHDPSRYDDKNELRFSLRSLEKYAPWIHHVYIVTNGQIPNWLDLTYQKVSIVTHQELSSNLNNLPTFSSAAIETFIHKIPNLSKRFLYMNDDIFLNAKLYPEDLYTNSEGVKVFNAWVVPDCAFDCPWVYIGDGACDQHCNIEDCQFDGGDCNYEDNDDLENHMLDMPDTVFYEVPKIKNVTSNSSKRTLKSIKNDYKKYQEIAFNESLKLTNLTDERIIKEFVELYNKKKKRKLRKLKDTETDTDIENNFKGTIEDTKDIFMHSLVYTNKLLNFAYGFKSRYVLAHVGFLLDKDIINEMQIKFKNEIEKTAENRFRTVEDTQFAFLYYNFLMSEVLNKTITEIFSEFDTDNSKTLSDREIRTFLSRIYPLPLDWAGVKYAEEVLNNCSSEFPQNEDNSNYITLAYERYEDSKMPLISLKLIENCPLFKEAMLSHFGQKNKYKFSANSKREMHSNFMMLVSNITEVINSLDKLRRSPKKFNCINDNLNPNLREVNEMVRNLLEDFYISFFPYPSKFELPDSYRNKFLYIEDFERWKKQKYFLLILCYIISSILIGVFINYICSHKAKCARKCIELL